MFLIHSLPPILFNVLTSKDNTKKLTVHYYTGKALGSYSIKQKSNDSVKASLAVSDKIYTRYSLELYLGGNSTVAQKRISVGRQQPLLLLHPHL